MYEVDNAIKEFLALIKSLIETRKNSPNCYLHDVFEKMELTSWCTHPKYIWQWNLTLQEYNDIKSLMSKYSSILKEVIQNKTCCILLQMYVSEWYKREYNGNDRQGNAFKSVGLTNISEELCYRLEKEVYHDSSGDCRTLDTLYVDGGLPLNYLLNKENSAFRRTIEDIIEVNAEGAEYLSDNLGDLCNNQVVNQSYKNKASIYDFVQDFVIKGNLLIEGFEEFTRLIQETNDKQLQKKIEVRYKVFKTAKCFQLIPQLFFRKEPNDVRYAISQERLNAWGAHPQNNSFVMEIKAQQNTIWKKQYTKCLRGDYISFPKSDKTDLRIEDYLCLEKWDVLVDGLPIQNKAIYNALREKGYVQMYSTDRFSWYSQSSNNYKYSAVLFDRTKGTSLNEDDETNIIVDGKPSELFGWKIIDEMLCFTISDKKTTLFNRAGELFVESKVKPLSEYYFGKCVEDKKLYLLYMEERPSFDVVYTKELNGEIVSQPLNEKEYKWEIKYGHDGSFTSLENSSHCGCAEIRITYNSNDKINKTIRCFFIPKKAEIRNITDANNRRTDFRNFNGLTIRYKDEKLVNDKGVWRKFWGSFSKEDYHCPEAKYQVTDGVVCFELAVDKPLDATVVKSTGSIVGVGRKEKENRIKLPILALDRIKVHQLPNNTFVKLDKYRFYSYAYTALMEHEYTDNHSVPNTYLDLQTFTHVFSLRQTIGNFDLSSLCFVFVPTKNPRNRQDIKWIHEDTLQFDIPSEDEGIVVQLVERHGTPLILLKPIYVPAKGGYKDLEGWERKEARRKRINNYHRIYSGIISNFDEAIDYFDVAVETGMYFGVFDALMGLVFMNNDIENKLVESNNSAKHLAQFYKQYVEKRNAVKHEQLWRMADEFLFDWCLIPQSVWNELFEDLTAVKELLRFRHHQIDWVSIRLKNKEIKDDYQNIILRTITGSYKGGNGRNSVGKASFWNLDLNSRIRTLNLLGEINNETISNYIQVE